MNGIFNSPPEVIYTAPPPANDLPRLTFGLEQELNFAVLKSQFQIFDDTQSDLEPIRRASNVSSSHNTGSEKKDFLRSHANYVLALLNHEIPHDERTFEKPSVLARVVSGEAKKHTYDAFTLVLDDSVMPKWDGMVKEMWNVDPHMARSAPCRMVDAKRILAAQGKPDADVEQVFQEMQDTYDRVGVELVSKVLDFEDQDHWMGCVRQIESDLAWNPDIPHGAWTDDEPHLHVHMAMRDHNMHLHTVQHVIIMYALFETEIERWHPAHQRENDFCLSMRTGTDLGPYTPHQFTQKIYATRSAVELRNLIYPRAKARAWQSKEEWEAEIIYEQWKNWMQVNVSLKRGDKKATLEFRHHRGTTNSEEIKWWVMFCGYLFKYAHSLTEMELKIADIEKGAENIGKFEFLENFTRGSILDHIGFPPEGIAYFRGKEKDYFSAHTERFRRVEGKLTEERIERVAQGEAVGDAMEAAIYQQPWFIKDVDEYDAAEKEDNEQLQRRAEELRKKRDNSRRERKRLARGAARRQVAEEDGGDNGLEYPLERTTMATPDDHSSDEEAYQI